MEQEDYYLSNDKIKLLCFSDVCCPSLGLATWVLPNLLLIPGMFLLHPFLLMDVPEQLDEGFLHQLLQCSQQVPWATSLPPLKWRDQKNSWM